MTWTTGDYLTHRFNPELGVGRVTAVEGRALVVNFPRTGATLRIAASSDALTRVASDAAEPSAPPAATLLPSDLDVRRDIRRLRSIREDEVVGSFLGGRVRLFPHQLYAAERATAHSPRLVPQGIAQGIARCAGCSPTKSAWGKRSRRA